MQFACLIAFLGLLLIQSRTAQCTFVCNDNGKLRDAKTGWCMRPFPSHPEERHLGKCCAPPLVKYRDTMLNLASLASFPAVLAAADPSFKDRFSCNHTSVYNRPTMSRWCCTATQPHRKQRQFVCLFPLSIKLGLWRFNTHTLIFLMSTSWIRVSLISAQKTSKNYVTLGTKKKTQSPKTECFSCQCCNMELLSTIDSALNHSWSFSSSRILYVSFIFWKENQWRSPSSSIGHFFVPIDCSGDLLPGHRSTWSAGLISHYLWLSKKGLLLWDTQEFVSVLQQSRVDR